MTYLTLVLGLLVLIAGGELLVRGAAGLALKARIEPLVVGLTVVAMGTSAPEFVVSLKAAIIGNADISVGNVVGSNIANIALVLGLTAIIFPVAVDRLVIRQDWPMMMITSLLFFIFSLDGQLSSFEGIFFFAILIAFTIYLIFRSKWTTGSSKEPDSQTEHETAKSQPYLILLLFIALGCAALYFGAEWLITSSVQIAQSLGLSEKIIGLTLVAVGTSLPELVASVMAALRKQPEIALGNLIGSNIFNILGVLGITSAINPIQISQEILDSDIYWMLGISAILFPLMYFGSKIGRINGFALLAVYFVYTTLLLV